MPDLRDLLHDAAPIATRDVDLGAVRARVRQRARRRVAMIGGVAAVLLLAAGVAVTNAATQDDAGRRIDVVDDPTTTTVPDDFATTGPPAWWGATEVAAPDGFVARTVAADTDAIWVGGTQGDANTVYRLDRSGNVLSTTTVGGAIREILLTERYVWVWGGGDDGGPRGGVGWIDRRTGELVDRIGWDSPITPDRVVQHPVDLAFDGEKAWVTDDVLGQVLEIRPGEISGGGVVSHDAGLGLSDIVALWNGEVWFRDLQAPGTIARIDRDARTVVDRVPWGGPLLAADASGIWTTDSERIVLLDPHLLAEGLSVATSVRVQDSAGTEWFAGAAAGMWSSDGRTLSRYSYGSGGEPELAVRAEISTVAVIAELDHLLYVDGTNQVFRWTPRLFGS